MTSKQKKEAAKVGMTASMAVLVMSGFGRSKISRRVHIASGLSLLGFSYWHYSLYQSNGTNRSKLCAENK